MSLELLFKRIETKIVKECLSRRHGFFLNPARGVVVFIFSGELHKDHKAEDRRSRNEQKEGWEGD